MRQFKLNASLSLTGTVLIDLEAELSCDAAVFVLRLLQLDHFLRTETVRAVGMRFEARLDLLFVLPLGDLCRLDCARGTWVLELWDHVHLILLGLFNLYLHVDGVLGA